MKPGDWLGKTALVTGASSGIGEVAALALARAGLRVILTARRESRLQMLAAKISGESGRAEIIPADLASESERLRLYDLVMKDYGCPDVLVNNAGLGWYGFFADMPWETGRDLIQVNVEAVVQLSLLFLRQMRRLDRGHIINVGSVSGSIPSQGVAVYSASKAFLDAFTTSLHRELKGTQVRASVVRPGPVATEFFEVTAHASQGRRVPAERFSTTPERVADCIVSLLDRPRRVVYVPGWLRVTPWAEVLFGWAMDQVGPLLLHRQVMQAQKEIRRL
ncbi:MAG: SDR family oxidoreductase [Chloroflexi bacterium]|nr:SDR family oxidoreductase [Chloroflexota bacterium]